MTGGHFFQALLKRVSYPVLMAVCVSVDLDKHVLERGQDCLE